MEALLNLIWSIGSIMNENLAIIISIFSLAVSVGGWFIVYRFNIRATNLDRKNNFQLVVYQNLLDRSNELIKLISDYTTSSLSHTNAMATVLTDYRSYDEAPNSEEKIQARYEAQVKWLEASHILSEKSFEMQRAIEDIMRFLDMNGTDYARGSVVYDALLEIKTDAYSAAEGNRKRWSNHKEMDHLTPKSYSKISRETKQDSDVIFNFGMCIDDVLTIVYNHTVSGVLGKPSKQVDLSEPRRYVTTEGILDNRG
jgi:hypothetical protein